MNKTRRKQLSVIIDRIEALKALAEQFEQARDEIASELEALRDEEQDAFDNMAESFQQGEKGQDMEAAIDNMTTAWDMLDAMQIDTSDMDSMVSSIDDARGQA